MFGDVSLNCDDGIYLVPLKPAATKTTSSPVRDLCNLS
jgi:hypothetical protein